LDNEKRNDEKAKSLRYAATNDGVHLESEKNGKTKNFGTPEIFL
jgi:hypothetical protein